METVTYEKIRIKSISDQSYKCEYDNAYIYMILHWSPKGINSVFSWIMYAKHMK